MYGRLIHLRGTRAKHAVIVRIPSIALPRCAADFSDGITSGSRSWPPRWPRRAMMALVKTRNRVHLNRNPINETSQSLANVVPRVERRL
jgi:hypothetical protein